MPGVVVDTDVVSYIYKRDSRGKPYRRHLTGRATTISFMTLAELERWTLESNWSARRRSRLRRWLQQFNVEPFDRALCRLWAEVMVQARRRGRPIDTADAWIAATAIHLDVPLVTHNPGDYAGVSGLAIITEATIQ